MACPGGCVGGGGTTRGVWGRNTAKRQQGIYAIDKVKKIRASYENPEVIRLYQEYLGSPGSERAHELLHCEYKPWKSASANSLDRRFSKASSFRPNKESSPLTQLRNP